MHNEKVYLIGFLDITTTPPKFIRAGFFSSDTLTLNLKKEFSFTIFKSSGETYEEARQNAINIINNFGNLYAWVIPLLNKNDQEKLNELKNSEEKVDTNLSVEEQEELINNETASIYRIVKANRNVIVGYDTNEFRTVFIVEKKIKFLYFSWWKSLYHARSYNAAKEEIRLLQEQDKLKRDQRKIVLREFHE
jgi:hypothetical protein